MNRFKALYGAEADEAFMTLTAALDEIATGEASLEQANSIFTQALTALDTEMAERLYGAVRSWVWKALESRRRDEELTGWMDAVGRIAAHLEDVHETLAIKTEALAELIHNSIMAAGAARVTDPLQRIHVRELLSHLYHGRAYRRDLLREMKLKPANLSNIVAPLRDRGWIQREMDGKDAIYRLTEKGREMATPVVAHGPEVEVLVGRAGQGKVSLAKTRFKNWGVLHSDQQATGPQNYLKTLGDGAVIIMGVVEQARCTSPEDGAGWNSFNAVRITETGTPSQLAKA